MEWYLFIRKGDKEKLVASSPSKEIIEAAAKRMSRRYEVLVCTYKRGSVQTRRVYKKSA